MTTPETTKKHHAISRRNLLILGGVAVATAAVPASFRLFEHEAESTIDELLAMLSDREGAAMIGRRWLETTGQEKQKTVAAKITKRLRTHGWQPGNTPQALHEALGSRIRHDFEHGDMVEVSGWQLSRTSVELCVLAALHQDAVAIG